MKITIKILVLLISLNSAFAQETKTMLGKACYIEEISGDLKASIIETYKYNNRIELKFESGYQITIKEELIKDFISILNQYEKFHSKSISANINSPQLIENFSPEHISKGTGVIDASKVLKIYYVKELKEVPGKQGNLVFEIPALTDIFGSGKAPGHYIFIPGSCIEEFIKSVNI